MKKIISLLLAVITVLTLLSGCGGKKDQGQKTDVSQNAEKEETKEDASSDADTEKDDAPETEETEKSEGESEISPLCWKVTDKDGGELYLFGTIHVGDERNEEVLEKADKILSACDALAVEFDVVAYESDTEQITKDAKMMVYDDGTKITDHISEETYKKAVDFFKEAGYYNFTFDFMKAGIWTTLPDEVYIENTSLSTDYGMDALLIHRAYDHDMPVLDLESPTEQYLMMINFSDELCDLIIRKTLEISFEEYDEELNQMYECWLAGDEKELAVLSGIIEEGDEDEYTEEELALMEEYTEAMLENRNKKMAEKAVGYLESGDTVFMTAGCAHMLSDIGVVQLLKDRGYTAERIDIAG